MFQNRTIRPILGLICLTVIFSLLAFVRPIFKVVEHNVEADIDATPIFYSDVDNMRELERGVAESRAEKMSNDD